MGLATVGGDVLKEMWKGVSGGEEDRKARQQVTSDGFGRARRQKRMKEPPGVAKYNFHGCDSLSAERQQ
jgi:hypothetical protein